MEEEIKCNNCDCHGDSAMLISLTEAMDDPCDKCLGCESEDVKDVD